MSIVVDSPAALADAVGSTATGDWFAIDQQRIQAFADATEDWQWIHLDAERAASGPFGATIAHGYLTLSLLPRLTAGLLSVDGAAMVVNYGLDKVRFLQPVVVGLACAGRHRGRVGRADAAGVPGGLAHDRRTRGLGAPGTCGARRWRSSSRKPEVGAEPGAGPPALRRRGSEGSGPLAHRASVDRTVRRMADARGGRAEPDG